MDRGESQKYLQSVTHNTYNNLTDFRDLSFLFLNTDGTNRVRYRSLSLSIAGRLLFKDPHCAKFFKRMQCGKIVGHGKRERRRWQKFNCQNRPPFNLWWNTLVYNFAIFNLIFSCSWLVWAAGRKCWNIVKHNLWLKALISLRPEGVGPSIIV